MKRVTILKVYADAVYDAYGDQCFSETFQNAVENAEFQEISDEEFHEIRNHIRYNLNCKNSDYKFVIVECPNQEDLKSFLIKDIAEYAQKIAKEQEEYKEQERLRKKKAAEKALERKKKQLEKLKKELEGSSA